MTHLTEEDLTSAYYGERDSRIDGHLKTCPECQAELERLAADLDSLRESPVPERGPGYGKEVWVRLLPHLEPRKRTAFWTSWRLVAPALATLILAAFLAGVLFEKRNQPGDSAMASNTRQRVLLLAISDHLQRSEVMLTELLNSSYAGGEFHGQREAARDLIADNRLLRESAVRSGDVRDAALLDDLERVLLNLANSPSNLSPDDLKSIRDGIENQSLLFKVRITSIDIRHKAQNL